MHFARLCDNVANITDSEIDSWVMKSFNEKDNITKELGVGEKIHALDVNI